ncbi:MAG: serine protease [Isosphaeraceae bacterium]|nr:serine protease [Isosphaeraceae bacterium]
MELSADSAGRRFGRRAMVVVSLTALATFAFRASWTSAADRAAVRPADNLTFRPTVLLRQGSTQGSGTVIASADNDTLILTAAHVVDSDQPVVVELHRYNLGVESIKEREGWPRRVAARVVARDPAADVALVRIKGMTALPFVARLDLDTPTPERGTAVVSVGIDRGTDLNSWSSQVRGSIQLDMDRGGGNRPFLITSTPPEVGRSGGGLFRAADGLVIGVCVGRVEVREGRRVGVFASGASIRRLLQESGLLDTVVAAQARRKSLRPRVETTRGGVAR